MTVAVPQLADFEPAVGRSSRQQTRENPTVGRLAWFDARRQLLLCLVALPVMMILLAAEFLYVLGARISVSETLHDRAGRSLVAAQELRAALSQADAAAAADVFAHVELVAENGLAAEERREVYDKIKNYGVYSESIDQYSDSIEDVARRILELQALDPDPDFCEGGEAGRKARSQCPLTVLAARIPEYTGLVERARANSRAGLPLGETYLTTASALMRDRILPETEPLVIRYGQNVDTAYRKATSGRDELGLAFVFGVAVLALLAAHVFLFRRTNRYLNACLAFASLCVLACGIMTAWEVDRHQNRLADARESGYEPMTLLAESKTRALQARADQNFSLISLGSSAPFDFDQRFGWTVNGLGYDEDGERLTTGSGARRGSLVAALDALRPDGVAGDIEPGDIERDFRMWLKVRARVVELLEPPPTSASGGKPGGQATLDEAVMRTLGEGADAFRRFVDKTEEARESSEKSFDEHTGDAIDSLRILVWTVSALVGAAALLCFAGLWLRFREYR